MGRLNRALNGLAQALTWTSAALLLFITSLVAVGVTARYVFNAPIPWTDEAVSYLLVWTVMLAAPSVLYDNGHISVDLLTERLSPRGQAIARAWSFLVVAVVCAILAWAGWKMVEFSKLVDMRPDGYLNLPLWIPQFAVPLGMGLLVLTAAVRLLGEITAPPAPKPEAGSDAP